jgi:hypothetical protein
MLAPGQWSGPRRAKQLDFQDFLGLQALGSLNQLELHDLSLVEGAITITLDGAEMDKYIILAFLPCDEAEPFGVIEPFNCAVYTICHTTFLGLSFCFY